MSINSNEVKRIVRFLLVGLFNTGLSYTIFSLVFFFWGERFVALSISYFIALIISFFLNRSFVFQTKGGSMLSFIFVNLFSFIVNILFLAVLVDVLLLSVYFSQFLCLFTVSVMNYIGYKYIFRGIAHVN